MRQGGARLQPAAGEVAKPRRAGVRGARAGAELARPAGRCRATRAPAGASRRTPREGGKVRSPTRPGRPVGPLIYLLPAVPDRARVLLARKQIGASRRAAQLRKQMGASRRVAPRGAAPHWGPGGLWGRRPRDPTTGGAGIAW
ncbi:hypothetical protein PVAP13_5NG506586 [Panicum virgatum]|uniref:Uncharacterized protein n=1 Tax=Panicum virgatum TaxID=38727 RepID=A0A8T0RYU7_PANVG|nr:hypothetical protein PVAP13_5NG506586 [Panicum virgatum]